jgi:thiol:disulfide interchange protein DsbC
MEKIIEKRKDISFYIILFPLTIHPAAYDKSKSIVCEKSLALLHDAYEKKPLPKPNCETHVIDDNIKLGQALGITGVPALILPNGTVLMGYKDAETLLGLIGN